MSSYPPVDHQARAEDVHWLAITGEGAHNAADRLGITYGALEKWAKDHALDDWHRLRNNEPDITHNGGINQYTTRRTA